MAVGGPTIFASDSPNFQSSVQVLIARTLRETLRKSLAWLPPGVGSPSVYVQGGGTPASKATFRNFAVRDLPIGTPTPIIEATPPTPTTLEEDFQDFVASQFGRVVRASDIAILQSPHNLPGVMVDKITRWGAETMDAIVKAAWATHTSGEVVVLPEPAGGGTGAATNPPTLRAFVRAAAVLGERGVPKVNGAYNAIISENTRFALGSELGQFSLQEARTQTSDSELMTNELGTWYGVRFLVASGNAIKETATVFRDIVCGAEAMAYSELSQISSSYLSPTPTPSDPLGQNGYCGTKFFFGAAPVTVGAADGTVANSLRYVAVHSTAPTLP